MPITEFQAARIAAYYEARKPYHALLFEAMDNAPPTTPGPKPKKSKGAGEKREGAGETQPQPGEQFRDLVELLNQSKITGGEGEKKGKGRG